MVGLTEGEKLVGAGGGPDQAEGLGSASEPELQKSTLSRDGKRPHRIAASLAS